MSQTPEFAPAYVSVVNEFPEDLYDAMRHFVCTHPHWDQYRLMQVAVAGFLFQQGSRERAVARHYLDGLFDRGAVGGRQSGVPVPCAQGDLESDLMPPPLMSPQYQRPGSCAMAGTPLRPDAHHPSVPHASRHAA